MANLANMFIPLTIILVAINAFVLFTSFLPADQHSTLTEGTHIQYGIDNPTLTNDINNFSSDMLGVRSDANTTGVQATSQPRTDLMLVAGLFFGAATFILTGGNIFAAATATAIGGILGAFMKYTTFLFFGFNYWIDYFFLPLGSPFTLIGMAFKGLFFFIQIIGLIYILLPIFASGRRS